MNSYGKKQVKEAVLIATLSTLAAGVVTWTLDTGHGARSLRRRDEEEKAEKEEVEGKGR